MAYASRSGRASTNPANPRAFAVCDRCGNWWNRDQLQWQFDWRGARQENLRILVCHECYDEPQEQLRSIAIPADPEPIIQPRTEPFYQDEVGVAAARSFATDPVTGLPLPPSQQIVTQGGQNMSPAPIGAPAGLTLAAIMPFSRVNGVVTPFGVPIPVLSVTANGTSVVNVTTSKPHGLATSAQIAVEGLSNPLATGFFSITVTGAASFTYQCLTPIPSGGLLTSGTLMVTANVGLPRGETQIPQVGSR